MDKDINNRFWRKDTKPNNHMCKISFSRELRDRNKSNDEFEIMMNNLTLEELVALKLELASKSIGGKFFRFPIYDAMTQVVKSAVVFYAYSASKNYYEAADYVGRTYVEFKLKSWLYGVGHYFNIDKNAKKIVTDKKKSHGEDYY